MPRRAAALEEALAQAARASGPFRHGAVLVCGRTVVAAAHNTYRHHAERNVFRVCPRHFLKNKHATKLTLVVARLTPGGAPALSLPCPACQAIIRAMNVKLVLFTTGAATGAASGTA